MYFWASWGKLLPPLPPGYAYVPNGYERSGTGELHVFCDVLMRAIIVIVVRVNTKIHRVNQAVPFQPF